MWCTIRKFCTKAQYTSGQQNSGAGATATVIDGSGAVIVVGGDKHHPQIMENTSSSYDTLQSKQRASVKWLLSKAFNNNVPENLREPFYRDHENQEHLKPQISGALANAELYCLALGHIYSDPNYHNLNHWAILQTLARKGVYDQDNPETEITETILIQTNPLRMNAHMAVIEAIMCLYAKEVASSDQITAAVQRISQTTGTNGGNGNGSGVGKNNGVNVMDPEQGLLVWVNCACDALQKRIAQEQQSSSTEALSKTLSTPVSSVNDLAKGVALAALVSFYCPDDLPWRDIIVPFVPTVPESLHNVSLVFNFCRNNLPANVFHMMPEDITYMRSAMKQNLIVFLADMFNVLEIHPVKCVRYPGMDRPSTASAGRNSQGVAHKRNLPPTVVTAIPDLRSGLDTPPPGGQAQFTVPRLNTSHSTPLKRAALNQSTSEFSEDSLFQRRDSEESFVVHHNRGIPTLSSVITQQDERLMPARLRTAKEKQNNDTKADERGDVRQTAAAGKPSNWEDSRKNTTFSGRRSRRNSFSEESQLTIENFGGSQDHLNFIGRNPDKDFGKKPTTTYIPAETAVPTRSSLQDARGSIQISYEEYSDEKQDNGREKSDEKKSPLHNNNVINNDSVSDHLDGETIYNNKMASFAELSKMKMAEQKNNIHIVYMQHDRDDTSSSLMPSKSSLLNKKSDTSNGGEKKTTTFAALPTNTTTWQQQSSNNYQNVSQLMHDDVGDNTTGGGDVTPGSGNQMASQLNNIRLKLEEKRRHIESEKRRMELIMNKQRQKVGKAAFLQAVTKGKVALKANNDIENDESQASSAPSASTSAISTTSSLTDKPQRPFSLKEIGDDVQNVQQKWFDSTRGEAPFVESRKTPDIENMDLEQYQQSLAMMNSSLHDIQADIQRLASQQSQIQHQNLLVQQQQMHQATALALQQQFASQQNLSSRINNSHTGANAPLNQMHHMFSSASHIPQQLLQNPQQPAELTQFYLHEQNQTPPVPPQRRTWGSVAANNSSPSIARTFSSPQQPSSAWSANKQTYSQQYLNDVANRYQNGDQNTNNHLSYVVSPSSISPQHRGVHRQISHMLSSSPPPYGGGGDGRNIGPVNLKQMQHQDRTLTRSSSMIHAPVPVPDDMEPQNISFIGNSMTPTTGDEAQILSHGLNKLNITSGSRTYRIPSPTRPSINRNSFQMPNTTEPEITSSPNKNAVDSATENEKGFYISFDNEQPKRPKPPLRLKRGSPKKERSNLGEEETVISRRVAPVETKPQSAPPVAPPRAHSSYAQDHIPRTSSASPITPGPPAAAIIIGNEPDPNSLDEMEKKKERILMLSLQRRQQQEEAKARKEAEAHARREYEKAKQEDRLRKKEEQAQRRAIILEQYKMKKAIEEAEREGKVLDKSEFMASAAKPIPKMRAKTTGRPRPKTIHVDTGSVEMAEGILTSSRGKKGSSSNLTNTNTYNPSNSSMRRDYYRGSHDSLSTVGTGGPGASGSMCRSRSLYATGSPDDGRGSSPSCSGNQTLGRRSSYKTSRDNVHETGQMGGRSKFAPTTNQNLRVGGRKSNSMMNLCGSSSDQDSLMYRYGADTDSGLGRATPPRRAPSPGMPPSRHLPSPSGPGSLPPGLVINKRRQMYDDGCSDISSTPSSMMDYSGPRLYKQPATKSNRNIMLNAVEYCVFPGVVNKESKRRVLEEIARSESKHFLILFRDAGCQFRALYSYCPEREEVLKLYGTGPKQVNDRMFDKFFKYNSGGKCFSQIHTKHLTVTIDAFTIHNALWQGKKVNLPNKKDMTLVI